ncbi:MAG: glucose/arabinose dehydrogenase [Flavobacteriales bacterium]|jgi:glucose/arabinose dehydrogenase
MNYQGLLIKAGWLIGLALLLTNIGCEQSTTDSAQNHQYEIIADSLVIPWNIEVGPDNYLWACEQNNRILRISLKDYSQEAVSLVGFDYKQFFMHGLAFRPNFEESGLLYLSILYFPSGIITPPACLDVVNARYSKEKNTISLESIIVDSLSVPTSYLPGGRLRISKDNKLLITASNEPTTMRSQSLENLSGKILRYNFDGSIPDDNPFPNSPIYTYGHRNPQGLVVLDDGRIFVSEHGPSNDDEVNEIQRGGNYGWPLVEGKCDTEEELLICDSLDIMESRFNWTPTIAPSSLLYYNHSLLPNLENKFLVSTLKESDVRVLSMDEQGVFSEDEIILDGIFGRIRDMAVDAEGNLYLSTANNIPAAHSLGEVEKDTSLVYDVIVKVYK